LKACQGSGKSDLRTSLDLTSYSRCFVMHANNGQVKTIEDRNG